MFWPLCLERKVWNNPIFWLHNLYKSLEESSQRKFVWNISFEKKSSGLRRVTFLSGFLCCTIQLEWGNSGVHGHRTKVWSGLSLDPCSNLPTVSSEAERVLVYPCVQQQAQISGPKQPVSFCKMTCYLTTVLHRKYHQPGQGKGAHTDYVLRRARP